MNDAVVVVVVVGATLEVVVSGTTEVVVDAGAVTVGAYQAPDESPAISCPKCAPCASYVTITPFVAPSTLIATASSVSLGASYVSEVI